MKLVNLANMFLGFVLSISAHAASNDWSELKGCYQTVTYNGQPGSSKIKDRGHGKLSDNFGLATMPGVDHIRSFDFTLFKYRQGDTKYMDFVSIFPDYGTFSTSADGKTKSWHFDGPMVCTGLCHSPTPFTMHTKVEITDLGNEIYQVHNWRQIPELPDQSMNADDTYVVKRDHDNCVMCESNPDGSYTCNLQP